MLQEILKQYKPRASVVPAELDFTDCPYMWPFCRQPLYANAMPLMFNATVLNGMGLIGAPCCLASCGFIASVLASSYSRLLKTAAHSGGPGSILSFPALKFSLACQQCWMLE